MKRALLVVFAMCARQTAPVELAGTGTIGPLPSASSVPAPPPSPGLSTIAVSPSGELVLPSAIHFRVGSEQLLPDSEPTLQRIVEFMRERPDVALLRVEVHADSMGSSSYNMAMTEKRALVVGKWLLNHGADCARLDTAGYGDTRPIAPNTTEEGRAQNRRTVFSVVPKGASTHALC